MAGESTHDLLEWRVHPAAERLGTTCAVLGVIAALAVVAAVLMQSILWGVFAVAILLLALNRYFLPSRFRIDAEGITARYPGGSQYLSWASVRRFRHDAEGAYLSSRARCSLLDGYQGLHLQFGPHAEQIVERIRRHLRTEADRSCSG